MESKLAREVAVCFASYSSSFFLNAIWKWNTQLVIESNTATNNRQQLWFIILLNHEIQFHCIKCWMQIHLHDCVDKENYDANGVERHEDAHGSASSAPSTGCLRLHGWILKISKSTMMLGLAQLTWIPGPPMDGLMPGTGPGRRSFSMVCCLVRTGTEMDEICR